MPLIPSISYSKLLRGQAKMMSLQQIKWRYWLLLVCWSYTVYHRFFLANWMQQVINHHRQSCLCDVRENMYAIAPFMRDLHMMYDTSESSWDNFVCKYTCP